MRQPAHTWPLQCGPAPIPMVGMDSSLVTAAATTGGTHSSTIAKHPASCRACTQRSTAISQAGCYVRTC